jgi:hypothetical protein
LGPDSLILDDWWKSDGGLGYSVGKSLLFTLGAVLFCPKVLFSCNPYFLNLVSLSFFSLVEDALETNFFVVIGYPFF